MGVGGAAPFSDSEAPLPLAEAWLAAATASSLARLTGLSSTMPLFLMTPPRCRAGGSKATAVLSSVFLAADASPPSRLELEEPLEDPLPLAARCRECLRAEDRLSMVEAGMATGKAD